MHPYVHTYIRIIGLQTCSLYMYVDIQYTYSLIHTFTHPLTHSYIHTYQAVELFSEANDKGYDDVVQFIRNFLQRADVVALLDATIPGHQPATSYYHSSIDRKEEAEREVMQAVIHQCTSVDEDAASAHKYTQRRSSMNKKGNSCSSSGSREEDEDDITMQLSDMLNDMNLEFDDIVQTYSKTPGKETRSSRSGNDSNAEYV